jgi:multiple sugar transport system substrate-binding protein
MPVGPVGRPTELHLMFPMLAMNHTRYPQACKALMAFMQEQAQFDPWIEAAAGYLSPGLAKYDANPVWTSDPKRTPYRDVAKRSLTVGGLGSVGEKAASAVADYVLLDMFASSCTGSADIKGAIRAAERQLQRIYR